MNKSEVFVHLDPVYRAGIQARAERFIALLQSDDLWMQLTSGTLEKMCDEAPQLRLLLDFLKTNEGPFSSVAALIPDDIIDSFERVLRRGDIFLILQLREGQPVKEKIEEMTSQGLAAASTPELAKDLFNAFMVTSHILSILIPAVRGLLSQEED